jgi:hypothetical protein
MRLDKMGSSNLAEQQQIIERIMSIFSGYNTCVLGDREFCGVELANWLRNQGFSVALRLKKSHYIQYYDDIYYQLSQLGLAPGVSLFLAGVKVTKTKGFGHFNLAAKWSKNIRGKQPSEGWLILTNLTTCRAAMSAYSHRFSIEEMFRDFKTGGYNIEDIRVDDSRIIAMLALVFIAYFTATGVGQTIKHQGYQKYLGRMEEPARTTRRHSSFYLGCHGVDWLDRRDILEELVSSLMRLTPNKYPYYRRGQRAMMLVTVRL